MQHISGAITFDSTHFPSSTSVTVAFAARGDDGNWYYAQPYSIPVVNRAAIYGRYDLEIVHVVFVPNGPSTGYYLEGSETWEGCPTAETYYQIMNYETRMVRSLGWNFPPNNQDGMAADLAWCTTAYVNTHGAPLPNSSIPGDPRRTTFFNADDDDVAPYWLQDITDPHMLPEGASVTGSLVNPRISIVRQNAIGSGYPPHNSGNPPISLAWIDGCRSGLGDQDYDPVTGYSFRQEFSGAFLHPLRTTYDADTRNQAFCGLRMNVAVSFTRGVAVEFYSKLYQGWSVNRARIFAFGQYNAADKPADAHDWMAVYGDWATRLHGVFTYADDPVPVTAWIR